MKLFLPGILIILILLSCNRNDEEYSGVIEGNAFLAKSLIYSDSIFSNNSNIKITLVNKAGSWTQTVTNADGNYKFDNVSEGEYMLKFEKAGFTYFELYNILHNGIDTLDLSRNRTSDSSVRLLLLKTTSWKIVNDLWIGYYLGSLEHHNYMCGRNFQIITEVNAGFDMACIAFIDTSKNVDCFHYKLAVPVGAFRRGGIQNPIMPISLSLFDMKVLKPSALIYIRFYPCITLKSGFDPWMGVEKYFGLIPGIDKTMWIKLPRDTMYFWGQPGCN